MKKIKVGGVERELDEQEFMTVKKLPVFVKARYMSEPFEVETLEGTHRGNAGDWLIIGVNGELYPIKPDILLKTYSIVCPDCKSHLGLSAHYDAGEVDLDCPECGCHIHCK